MCVCPPSLSLSVVVKNPSGQPVPQKTLEEAGAFTVCWSSAWNNKIVSAAYWVSPSQVSKTAESGEYLPTGSFVIRGKRNYLLASPLVMGFGVLFRVDPSCAAKHAGERKALSEDGAKREDEDNDNEDENDEEEEEEEKERQGKREERTIRKSDGDGDGDGADAEESSPKAPDASKESSHNHPSASKRKPASASPSSKKADKKNTSKETERDKKQVKQTKGLRRKERKEKEAAEEEEEEEDLHGSFDVTSRLVPAMKGLGVRDREREKEKEKEEEKQLASGMPLSCLSGLFCLSLFPVQIIMSFHCFFASCIPL